VVGGPGALAGQVSVSRRPAALALWGACTPAGLAVSAVAGGFAAGSGGWREWFAVLAIMCAGLAGVMAMPARGNVRAAPAVWGSITRSGLAAGVFWAGIIPE